jgi:predicted nucleotidyltransferase
MDKRKDYVLLLINAGVQGSENVRVVTIRMLHQLVVRNTIFRKALPSVVSGYGKRSINLNKVVVLLINAGVRSSVSECKKSRRLLHYV